MTTIGQSEKETQNRVIALFRDELKYTYLGDMLNRLPVRHESWLY
jgi:type I restriction enzyme R subunit